jgi:hypothetical protein
MYIEEGLIGVCHIDYVGFIGFNRIAYQGVAEQPMGLG